MYSRKMGFAKETKYVVFAVVALGLLIILILELFVLHHPHRRQRGDAPYYYWHYHEAPGAPGVGGAGDPVAVHDCASHPCHHGGVCENTPLGFTCHCKPGFRGERCEEDIDECASNPCPPYTRCVDRHDGYICDADECASCPCENFGICHDGLNFYKCECQAGYEGKNCENEVDYCADGPCVHGNCTDGSDSFTCDCWAGWEGETCDQKTDACLSAPCQNSGKCLELLEGYLCVCPSGYEGEQCENDCLVSPRGVDYRGFVNHTASGLDCIPWENTTFYATIQAALYDEGHANTCRNPGDSAQGVYCFYNATHSEACDIPLCTHTNYPTLGP